MLLVINNMRVSRTSLVIGDKVISNYLHNLTGFEIDFPLAPELEKALA